MLAITEGNPLNGSEIGIASIDLKHPEITLLQVQKVKSFFIFHCLSHILKYLRKLIDA